MRAPTLAQLARRGLDVERFNAACAALFAGRSPAQVAVAHGLSRSQLAYVRRHAGEPAALFPCAEQLGLFTVPGPAGPATARTAADAGAVAAAADPVPAAGG